MFCYCPPYLLATAFGSEEDRAEAMSHFRKMDEGLKVAHRMQAENPQGPLGKAIAGLLKDLWWHSTQLSLEALQCARNTNFDSSRPEMQELAFGLFAGPQNTKHTAEDVFAHLTHVQSRSQKGLMRMSKWPL